jgi:hypothetical protein
VKSNFTFLKTEWPELHDAASKAEALAYPDSRTACFYARRGLELTVAWLYKHDAALKLPYQDHLSALIHAPSFRNTVGAAVFAKMRVIKDLGNLAVHSHKPVREFDAITASKELFHVMFWLARTYGRGAKPADGLSFGMVCYSSFNSYTHSKFPVLGSNMIQNVAVFEDHKESLQHWIELGIRNAGHGDRPWQRRHPSVPG